MKNKNFTKDDLKIGYIVRTKYNNELRMVMETNGSDGTVLVREDGWFIRLSSLYSDLTHKCPTIFGDFTITEVYGYRDCGGDACEISTKNRELLWKREITGTEPTNNTTNEREDGNMSKKFTKKDLKVGYVVKCKNYNLYMVMLDNRGELGFSRLHGRMTMDCYDNELRCVQAGCNEFDIVEVYDRASLSCACTLSTDNRELLWKREEKTCDNCAHKVVCTHVGMCEHYMEAAK